VFEADRAAAMEAQMEEDYAAARASQWEEMEAQRAEAMEKDMARFAYEQGEAPVEHGESSLEKGVGSDDETHSESEVSIPTRGISRMKGFNKMHAWENQHAPLRLKLDSTGHFLEDLSLKRYVTTIMRGAMYKHAPFNVSGWARLEQAVRDAIFESTRVRKENFSSFQLRLNLFLHLVLS
jgi:hypothetical protein